MSPGQIFRGPSNLLSTILKSEPSPRFVVYSTHVILTLDEIQPLTKGLGFPILTSHQLNRQDLILQASALNRTFL